jgi:hypothetical protein
LLSLSLVRVAKREIDPCSIVVVQINFKKNCRRPTHCLRCGLPPPQKLERDGIGSNSFRGRPVCQV